MDPNDSSKGRTVTVSAATYAVVRTERSDLDAFTTIRDGTKTTVVVKEGRVDEVAAIEIKRGWKRLTLEMVLPFELVGFLVRVTSAFTAEDISVFALSAYSTDHVLVREDDVAAATTKFKSLGGAVERIEDFGGGN